jgi:hypothetical protein
MRTGDGSHGYAQSNVKDENGNYIEERKYVQQYWGLGKFR